MTKNIRAHIEQLKRELARLGVEAEHLSSDRMAAAVVEARSVLDRLQAVARMAPAALSAISDDAAAARERLALVAAPAHDGVFEWNLETGDVYYSSGFKAVLGYDERELAPEFEEWRKRIHPDDYAAQLPAFRAHYRGRSSHFRGEYRLRHQDGSYRWVLTRARLISDEHGKPHHLVGSLTDITDRKRVQQADLQRAEAALHASEERYRALYDDTPSMYFTVSADGFVLSVNRFGAAQLGYHPNELVGASVLVVVHPEDHATVREQLAACLREPNRLAHWEFRKVRKDGSVLWVREVARAIQDADGQARVLVVCEDVTEHKQTVEALRQSEERFALAMRGANDGLWDWNLETNVLYFSPRWKAVLGYEDDAIAHDVHEWIARMHPDDAERVGRDIRAHLLERTPYFQSEHRLRHRDGSYRWVAARGLCVRDARGKPYRMAGSLTDITMRKHAEGQLRESEEHFRSLIENSSELITVADVSGCLRYASPSIERVLGYQPADVVGRSMFEFIHPDDAPAVVAVLSTFRERPGVSRSIEARVRHGDGSWRMIEATGKGVISPSGEVWTVANSHDITDRKEVERALRENENRFRTLAETVPAATLIYQGRRLVYVNPAAERITGYTRDDLAQMEFWDVVHPDHRDLVRERGLARQRGENPPSRYEVKLLTKDGRERWVDFTAGIIELDGQPAVLGTAFDITDRRRAEEEARQRQLELAHVSRLTTLGEMAAGLAHELNQPLAAIVNYARGCARRLEDGHAEAAELLDVVERISTQAKRASDIVLGVRNFVRKGKPRRDWINVNDLVCEVARLAQVEAQRHRVAIDLELATDLPPVHADSIQIEQVILNLVTNGLESTEAERPPNGRLVLRTMLLGNDAVEVAVRDSGCGVAAELADKVFDAFFSTKSGGLGMGLSISRTIVESHGGRLWVSSNPDRGATFHFTLPVTTDCRAAAGT